MSKTASAAPHFQRLDEGDGRRKKNIGESPRSALKRSSSHTSRSPHESGHSQKRAADIFQTAKRRYQNVNKSDLPDCLRQTLPRATDHPLSLKYDPSTIPKTKQKDDMDRVADVLLTIHGEKLGNVKIDHCKLVGRAVFALRGFGEFEVQWGVGAYGKDLNERMGRLSSYGRMES